MRSFSRRFNVFHFAIFSVLSMSICSLASAQSKDPSAISSYPNKTVKIVAPGAGSGTDITARILAKYLTNSWKQSVIIENKPGAGGSIGINAVITSALMDIPYWRIQLLTLSTLLFIKNFLMMR